ncbi:hypothetical protein C9413_25345 [Rhizobium sp. SEMIA 4085]|uniref:hypothetical protein n=1 Tax=Rhizobium TaxID=379 RepID=UPI0010643F38|nr:MULTISPECIES: hypothetical protein [Rhizobium]NNH32650.1 hypothetical protein [Rhizobium sp. SEMIA 4085]
MLDLDDGIELVIAKRRWRSSWSLAGGDLALREFCQFKLLAAATGTRRDIECSAIARCFLRAIIDIRLAFDRFTEAVRLMPV